MTTNSQIIIFFTVAAFALFFWLKGLRMYHRNQRILNQHNDFYKGQPKNEKPSFGLPSFFRRRWSRMRSLLPKMRTAKVIPIKNYSAYDKAS